MESGRKGGLAGRLFDAAAPIELKGATAAALREWVVRPNCGVAW